MFCGSPRRVRSDSIDGENSDMMPFRRPVLAIGSSFKIAGFVAVRVEGFEQGESGGRQLSEHCPLGFGADGIPVIQQAVQMWREIWREIFITLDFSRVFRV